MITIDRFIDHSESHVVPLIREIFFLSADPKNIAEEPLKNEAFFKKWTGYYFKNEPDNMLLAWNDHKLLGYLMAAHDSQRALAFYQSRNPSYGLFADQFAQYPAHLHINTHPEARGQGVGTTLIGDLVRRLKEQTIVGLHLITAPDQPNVAFYRQNGFAFELQREWRSFPLLFMGRKV